MGRQPPPSVPVSIVWLVVVLDLAVAAFAGWLATQLDFFRTGVNAAQVLSALAAAMLVSTAVTLAWPRWTWLWKTNFGLNALALVAVVSISGWTALTAGTSNNPMWLYWRHAGAVVALLAIDLGALWLVAARTP